MAAFLAVTTIADTASADTEPAANKLAATPAKCPDIVVRPISVFTSKGGPHTGYVQFKGYYSNIGSADFVAPPGTASLQLWEAFPGQKPRLLLEREITSFAQGASSNNNFAYTRPWSDSGPEARTPATYRLVFRSEPNVKECNTANNVTEVSGADINARFRWASAPSR